MTRRPQLLEREELMSPPIQRRSFEKRARLKAAALAVFGEVGYQKASVEAITARAGVATGSFYLLFRGKRQMLLVLMDELLDRVSMVRLTMEPHEGPDNAIKRILTTAFANDLQYAAAYRAWTDAVPSDPVLQLLDARIRRWTEGRLRTVFLALQRRGGARATANIPALAHLVDRFIWFHLPELAHARRAHVQEFIETLTHMIHHSLFVDDPSARHGNAKRRDRSARRHGSRNL